MPRNPMVQLLICAAGVAWALYQLFAPGEAQSTGVVILQWFAVIGGTLGAIGAIYQLATGKQPGSQEKQQ
jgi:drug/metabolite transporter (DMT)-like permease